MPTEPTPFAIPLPEKDGVYTFTEQLLRVFGEHQDSQRARPATGEAMTKGISQPLFKFITVPENKRQGAPEHIFLQSAPGVGRPIVAIEPHADDTVLSAGGTLLSLGRPIHIVTVFSRSRTLHPKLRGFCTPTPELITGIREAESAAAAHLLNASHQSLGLWEAQWPWEAPDLGRAEALTVQLRSVVEPMGDVELIAPACVSRHPDHHLVRLAAQRLGCRWFWEDVNFNVSYARSIEDREYFIQRWGGTLDEQAHAIDRTLLNKLALLMVYQSQCFPPAEIASVMRYHWAVAREMQRQGRCDSKHHFVERLYTMPAGRRISE